MNGERERRGQTSKVRVAPAACIDSECSSVEEGGGLESNGGGGGGDKGVAQRSSSRHVGRMLNTAG